MLGLTTQFLPLSIAYLRENRLHDKIKYSYSVVCPIVVYNGVVPVQEGAWGKNPACREVAPCNPGSSVPACRAAVCAAVFVQPDMQFHHPLHAITT